MNDDSRPLSPEELEERFVAARAGDSQAYADLLANFLRTLRSVAMRHAAAQVARGQTASDYVSTVIRHVLEREGGILGFPSANHALRYLTTGVVNRAKGSYRPLKVDRRLWDRLKDVPVGQRPDSSDDRIGQEQLEALHDLIAALHEDESRLLQKVMEEHSWTKIGKDLGVSDKTAKQRFTRLCTTLREGLEPRE